MPVFSPIMLALCCMLLVTYYATNYAGIIGLGLMPLSGPALHAGFVLILCGLTGLAKSSLCL